MSDVLFFLRILVFTIGLVLLMQIQVGDHSIEQRAQAWVRSSNVVEPLNGVAKGASKLLHEAKQKIKQKIRERSF
ncbi:MAG: hypothetical protein AB7F86_16260 [Bdellovibrionales bacterium]